MRFAFTRIKTAFLLENPPAASGLPGADTASAPTLCGRSLPGDVFMKMPRPKTLLMISIITAVVTIALKMGAWYVTGSVSFLSDGMESFVNLAGAVFALTMVTVAERPADAEHPHGHHKAEYFSSGFEGVLIFGAALAILWAAVPRLWSPQPLEELGWGMGLSMLSTLLNGLVAWLLLKAAKLHNSIALEADGKHLRTDVYTSVGVIGGIGLVWATGWSILDPIIAIAVALNILREGWGLIHKSSMGLMDSALATEDNEKIQTILQRFEQVDAAGKPLVRFDHVFTRAAAQRSFVTMHLHLPPTWTLWQAAELRNQVEKALMAEFPAMHSTIELMPRNIEPVQVLLHDAQADALTAAGAENASA